MKNYFPGNYLNILFGPSNALPFLLFFYAEKSPLFEIDSAFVNQSISSSKSYIIKPTRLLIKKIAEEETTRITPTQATPFPEIIEKIVVTTIIPREKCFLVGTQSFKQGDQVPLVFRGKKIRAQVTEVTSRKIVFLNLDSGESATRKLDLLPAGMTSGQQRDPAPGMTQDHSTIPIELESADSAP